MHIPSTLNHSICTHPPPSKQPSPASRKLSTRVGPGLRAKTLVDKFLEDQENRIIRARLVFLFAAALAVKTRLLEKAEECKNSKSGEGSKNGENSE